LVKLGSDCLEGLSKFGESNALFSDCAWRTMNTLILVFLVLLAAPVILRSFFVAVVVE